MVFSTEVKTPKLTHKETQSKSEGKERGRGIVSKNLKQTSHKIRHLALLCFVLMSRAVHQSRSLPFDESYSMSLDLWFFPAAKGQRILLLLLLTSTNDA